MAPEFSRLIDRHRLPLGPLDLLANEAERIALARRFAVIAVERLTATVTLADDGKAVTATGRLRAAIVQSCAVSGEDLAAVIDEPLALRFVPEQLAVGDEIELEAGALDDIPFAGDVFDLGETVAQSLALAIDPYAVGPNAERVRRAAGLLDKTAAGPFAALTALKKG
ncbi:MAG: DUF177 domain-containing protein, partial [Croceibacterium sp.]